MSRFFFFLLALLIPAIAYAHPGQRMFVNRDSDLALGMDNLDDWFQWDFHPSIFIGCVTLIVLYTLGVTVWRKKYNLSDEPVSKGKAITFYSSVIIMYFALDGPMHYMSDELSFAAHMAQHLLLQMIFAPMFVLGLPSWVLHPIVKHDKVARFGRWISSPVRASILFNGVIFAWHIPEAYDLALTVHAWHIVEHLMFIVTAVIFWWPIFSETPEVPAVSLPARLSMIFVNLFPMKALGLILGTYNSLIYGFYATQPRLFGLTPLGDQRVGGLMMWVLGGLPLWAALGYVFVLWRRKTPAKGTTGVPELDRRLQESRSRGASSAETRAAGA